MVKVEGKNTLVGIASGSLQIVGIGPVKEGLIAKLGNTFAIDFTPIIYSTCMQTRGSTHKRHILQFVQEKYLYVSRGNSSPDFIK